MSKTTYPAKELMNIAEAICLSMSPFVERVAIAGSLRRGKQEVGDIEILYVPLLKTRTVDLFGGVEVRNLTEEWFMDQLEDKTLEPRPNIRGSITWGPQNKLARMFSTGIPVDFFSTNQERWFVSLVIRTGGKQTNIKLATGAQRLGRKLNAYGFGVTESDGTVITATSERHLFELCGVPYQEPGERE